MSDPYPRASGTAPDSTAGPLRSSMRRRPVATDVLLALAYLAVTGIGSALVFLATGVGRSIAADAVIVVALLVSTAALLLRRAHPRLLFTVMWASTIGIAVVDGGLDPLGVSLALYALAVHRSTRAAWVSYAVSVVAATVVGGLAPMLRADGAGTAAVGIPSPVFLLITLVAVLIGANIGARRRHLEALLDRADRLEHERDQQAAIATAAERARITREMHDIVAHAISVMVALADGADALAVKDPDRSRSAMTQVVQVGRRSLTDMHRVLDALDDGDITADDDADADAARHPQPGVAELGALVDGARAAGLPVRFATHGDPPPSPGLQTVVYRIVQESLTNAIRYAGAPSEVRVDVDFDDVVTITVVDDGAGSQERTAIGSGRGIFGMRERAHLYGGTVDAGPGPDGGWRVTAILTDTRDTR
ncbi:two-component sensor histidine kinase [Clavibacter michiganensis]|nr:two-component sensor histidine kinase [Clavibacter michiganensis]